MPRPKTKLANNSTEIFVIGKGFLGDDSVLEAADAANADVALALMQSPLVRRFVKKQASAIEEIKRYCVSWPPRKQTDGAADAERSKQHFGDSFGHLLLRSLTDVIVNPEEVLKEGRQSPKRLCHLLTVFPDFTIGYLAVLRRALLRHQRRQPDFQRAILALRRRQPIVDAYGRKCDFKSATDKEICAHLKIAPAIFKKAKKYLGALDQ